MGTVELNQWKLLPLSVEFQVVVVLTEYRLAPEHPHPTQLNDSIDGVKWVSMSLNETSNVKSSQLPRRPQLVNNAASLSVDLSKGFIVAGESAGASLTASIANSARHDEFFSGRQPSGQILQIPCVIDPRAYPEK